MADENNEELQNDVSEETTVESEESEELDPIEAEMLAAMNGSTIGGGEDTSEDKLKNILSMKVPLIVKVAQKKMCMENVLKLSLGSIIQFDKDVYENIELMVNNQTIGMGQPVKIGENFGLRLLQVGNVENTIKSLGGK